MTNQTMRVPAFQGGGKIAFIEKPIPTPGSGQLLIEVKANALCGSERGQFFNGTEITPGHEATGLVVASGPDTQTPVGTSGAIFLMDFCGSCRSCTQGYTNQCLAKRGDMGFNRDGGYGPYMLVHETIFFAVDDDISHTEATLLLDIMGTGGHAIQRAQRIRPDIQSVLIAGAGPIGLGILAMTKLLLGENLPVLITDLVPYRLALAERMGGTPINIRKESVAEGLRRYGHNEVDAAFDTSGKTIARQAALERLAKRGVLVCVGHGEGLNLTVSPHLISTERAVLGSEYFCYNELPANLERLRENRSYMNQIITHHYGIDGIEYAFHEFFAGKTGKVVIEQ